MKHYKSVEFCQFLERRVPPHKPKHPRKNAKHPYWKLSGDGSARDHYPFSFVSHITVSS